MMFILDCKKDINSTVFFVLLRNLISRILGFKRNFEFDIGIKQYNNTYKERVLWKLKKE